MNSLVSSGGTAAVKAPCLRCLAGIYQPTKGTIKTHGKLVPFIELGVGFNPELTGRENVYLNGALLGFSVEQVNDMFQDIVEFAELNQFMDQKLKKLLFRHAGSISIFNGDSGKG